MFFLVHTQTVSVLGWLGTIVDLAIKWLFRFVHFFNLFNKFIENSLFMQSNGMLSIRRTLTYNQIVFVCQYENTERKQQHSVWHAIRSMCDVCVWCVMWGNSQRKREHFETYFLCCKYSVKNKWLKIIKKADLDVIEKISLSIGETNLKMISELFQ